MTILFVVVGVLLAVPIVAIIVIAVEVLVNGFSSGME